MNRLTKGFLTTAMLLFATSAAWADRPAGRGNLHEQLRAQDERIDAGLRNGSLTHREARLLRLDQRDLRGLLRQYAEDGLSRGERRRIQTRLDLASRDIRAFSHNRKRGDGWTDRVERSGRDGHWNRGRHAWDEMRTAEYPRHRWH
jgi:hypothetical protein